MISLGNGTECIMFEKGEPLCTIGCSSAAERAWRGGAGPSTHLHKSFYNQFTQVQIPAAWEEKYIIRLCLIQYTLNFPDRFNFLEVKLNNWQRPSVSEKCGKTSQTNLCSNEDVLGGACWSLAGGTLWQSENCEDNTGDPYTRNTDQETFNLLTSLCWCIPNIDCPIFLLRLLLCGNIKFHIKTV